MTPRLCFFLLLIISSSLAVTQAMARRPEPPILDMHTSRDRAATMEAADERLRETLVHLQQHFGLPEGTLWPAWIYHPSQRDEIRLHLQDPHTRMQPLSNSQSQDYTIFASASMVPVEGEAEFQPTLILFRVHHDGRIMPIGFTSVAPGVPLGHEVNFFDMVHRGSRATWSSLRSLYGELRVVNP